MGDGEAVGSRGVTRADLDVLLAPLSTSLVVIDGAGSISYASPALEGLLGYRIDQVEGRPLADVLHPDDLEGALEALARWDGRLGAATGPRLRLRSADGEWIDALVDAATGPLVAPLGAAVAVVRRRDPRSEIHQELRQRLHHQDRLARLVSLFVGRHPGAIDRAVDEALTELGSLEYVTRLAVYRSVGGDLTLSHVWEAPAGAPTGALPPSLPPTDPLVDRLSRFEVVSIPSVDALDDAPLREALASRGVVSYLAVPMVLRGELVGLVSAEVTIWEVDLSPSHVAALRTAAGVFTDAFARQDAQRALTFRALHDPVTGLVNRARFLELLAAEVHPSGGGAGSAVVLVDLEGFKLVNDALGHNVGDELLRFTAARLREAAGERTVLARLGADDFACLLTGVTGGDAAEAAAALVAAVDGPVHLAGHDLRIRAVGGIVHSSDLVTGPGGPARMLAAADAAMRRTALPGAPRVVRFDHDLGAEIDRRDWIEADLAAALDRSELVLHYQPEVVLATGEVTGVEALLRWRHPTRGVLPAGAFVAHAEHTAAFGAVSDWVLEEACRQQQAWSRPLTVRVNLSARDISRPGFDTRLAAALAATGADPSRLCVEITETAVLSDPEQARRTCDAIRAQGVSIAIDDFGTGHWSMRSLTDLPVDILKVDRALVDGLDRSAAARGVVGAVLGLAESLGLEVVAEGIETEDELVALRSLGCRRGQGYLLGVPVPAEEIAGGRAP